MKYFTVLAGGILALATLAYADNEVGIPETFGESPQNKLQSLPHNPSPRPVFFDFGTGNNFGKGNFFGGRYSRGKTTMPSPTSEPSVFDTSAENSPHGVKNEDKPKKSESGEHTSSSGAIGVESSCKEPENPQLCDFGSGINFGKYHFYGGKKGNTKKEAEGGNRYQPRADQNKESSGVVDVESPTKQPAGPQLFNFGSGNNFGKENFFGGSNSHITTTTVPPINESAAVDSETALPQQSQDRQMKSKKHECQNVEDALVEIRPTLPKRKKGSSQSSAPIEQQANLNKRLDNSHLFDFGSYNDFRKTDFYKRSKKSHHHRSNHKRKASGSSEVVEQQQFSNVENSSGRPHYQRQLHFGSATSEAKGNFYGRRYSHMRTSTTAPAIEPEEFEHLENYNLDV
ncbi:uncharacterized protein LOC142226308 [Haematobia irritans]|uniref:uncharacterized protein LOC142226308 n=1 Tax=Haematobia irritans TaxID=7368 RepID=UPI003F4FBDEE